MFCDKCGNQLPDTAEFCTKCGARILSKEMPAGMPNAAPGGNKAVPPANANAEVNGNNGRKPKNNKKIIAVVGIVLALAVAIIAGTLIIQASPASKLKRQLKLAEKYLTEMNYEQALVAYNEAIKINPKCETAYIAMADIYVKTGRQEKAVAILENGLGIINTSAMSKKLNEVRSQGASANPLQQQSGQNGGQSQQSGQNRGQSQQQTTQAAQTPSVPTQATQTPTKAPTKVVVKSAKVGEYITFGSYEQDGNTDNGAEPIEWLVLDNQGDKMLVISRYGLDCQRYNYKSVDVTWETCTLRTWLNKEFYNNTFNDGEKVSIITTKLNNPDNASYGTKGGNATEDKIFCLSIDEANKYFASNQGRATKPTTYALKNGAYSFKSDEWCKGNCYWWLRSPGSVQKNGAAIHSNGTAFGDYHNSDAVVIRPAMWVTITNQSEQATTETAQTQTTTQATQTPTKAPTKTAVKSAKVGEYVTFGSYEQDGNAGNGAEAIEWLVLDNQGDKMLVISRYGLDCQPYNTTYTSVKWETCTLRNWLNTEFHNTAFSDSEKALVITTTIENPNNARYGIQGGNATSDNVFCLSIDEANRYFASDEARATKPTAYAVSRGAYASTSTKWYAGNGYWWLRSPGFNQNYAAYVNFDGLISDVGSYVSSVSYAVRPALWIAVNP